jgi:hypothetical protein
MSAWADANADGIALALILSLLVLAAALGAWCIEWLVEPRQSRHDDTADRQRRITDRGRRIRAGMRETHR